jgi:predicted component of viral defense system (DUF524 family)
VEVDIAGDQWQAAKLERNDRPLPLSLRELGGVERVVAEWPWSGTGHYELRLSLPGAATERVTWTVQPAKITTSAYLQMLEALELRLPVSIALGLQRLGALTGLRFREPGESTIAQELATLRRAIDGSPQRPGLETILPLVARDPHRVLSSSEAWVPRAQARRVNPSSLPRAFAGGSNLASDRLPWKLPEARVAESVDNFENRLLATFHEQTAQRLEVLKQAIHGEPSSERRTRLSANCDQLWEKLVQGRRSAAFLDQVKRLSHQPDQPSMVLLRRPEYRYALEGYMELNRSTVPQLHSPHLEAPLEGLPALYQTWGVLQVLDVLLEAAKANDFGKAQQRIVSHDPSGTFVRVLRNGKPAVTARRAADGTEVRLIPQRTYTDKGLDYRSISYRQEPDIAIEVERPGRRPRILLFDPKYKLNSDLSSGKPQRPKKDDIDTMHAYRDAIRNPARERVVEFAAILYPGPAKTYDAGLRALSAVPDNEEALRQELRRLLSEVLAP